MVIDSSSFYILIFQSTAFKMRKYFIILHFFRFSSINSRENGMVGYEWSAFEKDSRKVESTSEIKKNGKVLEHILNTHWLT